VILVVLRSLSLKLRFGLTSKRKEVHCNRGTLWGGLGSSSSNHLNRKAGEKDPLILEKDVLTKPRKKEGTKSDSTQQLRRKRC